MLRIEHAIALAMHGRQLRMIFVAMVFVLTLSSIKPDL